MPFAETSTATDAPSVSEGMHRYTVTVPSDGNGGFLGVFHLDVQEAGEWHFAPPQDVSLRLSDANGDVALDEEAPDRCPDLVTRLLAATLDVGAYIITLSATAAEVVLVVVSPAGDHHHDDHGSDAFQ